MMAIKYENRSQIGVNKLFSNELLTKRSIFSWNIVWFIEHRYNQPMYNWIIYKGNKKEL